MAVTRVFPKRQEDPLIQQLLERARQEAAQSSAIGSPSTYTAAAGGGFGPVAGVLTAQVLGGIRSKNALQAAENRLKRQDEFATKVSEIQRAIDTGPSEELIPGQITISPENQIESFRGVPYAPQAVTVGEPTEDRNMLGRVADALTGKERLEQETLSRNPQTALSQALKGADINELQYYDAIEDRNLRRRAEAERLLPATKEKIGFNAKGEETPYYEITIGKNTYYSKSPNKIEPLGSDISVTKPEKLKISERQKKINALLESNPNLTLNQATGIIDGTIEFETAPGGKVTYIDKGKILTNKNNGKNVDNIVNDQSNLNQKSNLIPFKPDLPSLETGAEYDRQVSLKITARKGLEAANELVNIIKNNPTLVTGIEGKINRLIEDLRGRDFPGKNAVNNLTQLLGIDLTKETNPESAKAMTLLTEVITSLADIKYKKGDRAPTNANIEEIKNDLSITSWIKSPQKAIETLQGKGESLYNTYSTASTLTRNQGIDFKKDPNFSLIFNNQQNNKYKYNSETNQLELIEEEKN
tara:strand:- start:2128 stop:3717 length:1590 start_codon:yes stop_codon:yes gene_type:complete